jgi:L-alanine-DL-glutamate epimerase-like enolase superfamily enzyme
LEQAGFHLILARRANARKRSRGDASLLESPQNQAGWADEDHRHIAQPDVTMAGGLTELKRIAALADDAGKRVVPHGYKSNITLACNLAFLGQHASEEMLEYSTSRSPLRWELTLGQCAIDADGRVAVPQAPGLGMSLNPRALQRYRGAWMILRKARR